MRVADCPSCKGCPLYGDGSQQFVGDQLKEGASVLLVAQTPEELRSSFPKVERQYLPLAGVRADQVSLSCAVRCTTNLPAPVTPAQFDGGKRGSLEHGVRFCRAAHHSGVHDTRLVVTQGDVALYSATGQRSAHEWRGWLLPYQSKSDAWLNEVWTPGPTDTPVLATVRLADLFGQPQLGLPMMYDWKKAGRVLRGEWPTQWPGFDPTPPRAWPRVSAFDTEFTYPGGILERYSLYDGGAMPWVIEAHSIKELALPNEVTVVMHNVEADLAYLHGFLKGGLIKTEDTMLMHSVLWSDLPHSLEFLGSLYARTNRWKHLFHRNPKVYSGGDALGTWDSYLALVREFQADSQSAWVYRNAVFPLTPIIMEAELRGLALDQGRVQEALAYHEARQQEVAVEAQAYCGYSINLGSSDQVGRWLYEVEKVGVKRGVNRRKGVAQIKA